MKIKNLSKFDRPREKLLRYGVEKLRDYELLALVIGKGKQGKNVLEIAKEILRKYPLSVSPEISFNEIKKISGIGDMKACQILACLELGKRIFTKKKSALFLNPEDVWEELSDIRGSKKEHFIIFFLDMKNQVIKRELISIGNLNASIVHPREVFEPAIRHSTAQIVLSHNHPSGSTQPSAEDVMLTKRLIKAGEILGIEIIDHVIVTRDSYSSLKMGKLI